MQIIKDFLTIRKEIYNYTLERNIQKVFRFYNRNFFPPTIWYTINPQNCNKLQPIEKTLNFELKEIWEELKNQFKENINIQEKVLQMIKKRNEEYNYRCWLIKLTTWKWKSHVIMDIINYYQTSTLILVHNIKTLWELQEKFKKFSNIIPKIYWWWKKEVWNITIITKKSFALDYKKIKEKFNLIICDEAPVWFTKQLWEAINTYCNNEKWIALYGLSGTPKKILLNQKDLEKYFWLTIEIKGQENNWYNYIPQITMFDYTYKWFYLYENPQEMRTAVSENIERLEKQIIEIKKMVEKTNCLLILTDRKNEVENFYNFEYISPFYANIKFIMTWDTKIEEDEKRIKEAEKIIKQWWKVIIIWTIQKVWIWVDIPFIDWIFLTSAIKFESTVIQAIGRWLRKYTNKEKVIVWVWNDIDVYSAQKTQKIKAIQEEYWIEKKDINFIKI